MCARRGTGLGIDIGGWVFVWGWRLEGKGGSCVVEIKRRDRDWELMFVQVMEEKSRRRLTEIVANLSLSEIRSLSKLSRKTLLAYILQL
jgi:hypothetical protein